MDQEGILEKKIERKNLRNGRKGQRKTLKDKRVITGKKKKE